MAEQNGGVCRRRFLGERRQPRGSRWSSPGSRGDKGPAPRCAWGSSAAADGGCNVTSSFLEHTGAVVTAIGDIFADPLAGGQGEARRDLREVRQAGDRPSRVFRGPKAYEQLFA